MEEKMLVKYVECESDLADAVTKLRSISVIAVDCEGINMSRVGTLELIQIAGAGHVFLLDIRALTPPVCQRHLREVFESTEHTKLLWDCRMDTDVIECFLDIKLGGILDLQLADALPRENGRLYIKEYIGRVKHVRSLKRVIAEVEEKGKDARMTELLEHKSGIDAGEVSWGSRPLAEATLQYAAADVEVLLRLADHLLPDPDTEGFAHLRTASHKYSRVLAGMHTQTAHSMQFSHNLIPLSVLHKGEEGSDEETDVHPCAGCLLVLPKSAAFQTHCHRCEGLCLACQEIYHRSKGAVTYESKVTARKSPKRDARSPKKR